MAHSVNWNIKAHDECAIARIVERFLAFYGRSRRIEEIERRMDLIACHLNGCPLDLAKLEAFDDLNLVHDICGIGRHIDRRTGKLQNFFQPRCAQPEQVGA
jgi:hypothetical protein